MTAQSRSLARPAEFQRTRRQKRDRTRQIAARIVKTMTFVNVIAVGLFWFLIEEFSEQWWFSSALTFVPRLPLLILPIALVTGALLFHRASLWWNVAVGIVVLIPVMDLHIPWSRISAESDIDERLIVVSCNVQGFRPDFNLVLQEISAIRPDVVAFQEALHGSRILDRYFQDWNKVHIGEFWIGSRYPQRLVDVCDVRVVGRKSAVRVEIDAPGGIVRLTNVHLSTPRHGLSELSLDSILSGSGTDAVESHVALRAEESIQTREFVLRENIETPALIVGDFNMPTSSHLWKADWVDLTNAFDTAGLGYGYTSLCHTKRYWPSGTPWLRIDHILASHHWKVLECRIGSKNGSDHRLITATLGRR